MTHDVRALAEGFDDADAEAWMALARKALGAADFDDALVRRTADGLARGPLFTRSDAPDGPPAARPLRARFSAACPWDIRQRLRHPDPKIANAEALADLLGGVTSLEVAIDPNGADGVMVRGVDDLDTVLADVMLSLAPVSFDAGPFGLQAAAMLVALWSKRGEDPKTVRGAVNLDPLGRLARFGPLARDLDVELADSATWAFWAADKWPGLTAFRADGRVVHEAGGTEAWEIAFAAATGLAYLDHMVEYDLPLELAAKQIVLACAVDADVHLGVAKLRALRRVWRRILTASGAERPAFEIHAFGSRRMLARHDPWTNLIRLTTAGFAAVAGGADVITLPTFTEPLGLPSAAARRLSRNVHVLLQEETHLGAVADPAGGSFHHEALSDSLARAAWTHFQLIQKEGGVERFIVEGHLAEKVAASRGRLMGDVQRRTASVVGVSKFAALDVRAVEVEAPDLDALRKSADARSAKRPKPEARIFRLAPDQVIPLAASGADLAHMTPPGPETSEPYFETPLIPIRLADPFERLRDAAKAFEERRGAPPTVFLAALGDEKDHADRATWTRNLFAAGGLAMAGGTPFADEDSLIAAYSDSNVPLAVLCAADEVYAERAVPVAQALAGAGAVVWMAGKPGPHQKICREAGVVRFLHIGIDVVEALEAALAVAGADDAP